MKIKGEDQMKWLKRKSGLESRLRCILEAYQDPLLKTNIVELGWLASSAKSSATAAVTLKLCWGYPLSERQKVQIKAQIQQLFVEHHLQDTVQIDLTCRIQSRGQWQSGQKKLPKVSNLIAVASAKGGVGKSTTASHLAMAIAHALNARTGLLDADIYGPNQPHLLSVQSQPPPSTEKKFRPIEVENISTMSIGYLIDSKRPLIWRGPMVSAALQQLLNDTLWPQLDYLVVDMPPGTGDIQLTLSKKYPLSGAIIVTTPQQMALADARRAIEMFKKVKVPILGIVENMSYFQCPGCDAEHALWGTGGAQKLAEEYHIPLLAQIPLMPDLASQPLSAAELADIYRQGSDAGWQNDVQSNRSPVAGCQHNNSKKNSPDKLSNASTDQRAASFSNDEHRRVASHYAPLYQRAAQRALAELALQKVNYQHKFPPVIVES